MSSNRILAKINSIFNYPSENVTPLKKYQASFGMVGIASFLLPCFVGTLGNESHLSEIKIEIFFRLIACFLCFLMILLSSSQKNQRSALSMLFWYFSLTFCLPFFSTYLLISKDFKNIWVVHSVISVFLLTILVSWKAYIFIIFLGVSAAIFFYNLVYQNFSFEDIVLSYNLLYIFFFTALSSYVFVHIQHLHIKSMQNKNLQIANKNQELLKIKQKLQLGLKQSQQDNTASDNKLAEALNFKKEIFKNVGHEIRTPLQEILNFIDGLKNYWQSFSDDEKFQQFLMLESSVLRLESFLTNLIDASSLDSGKMLFDFKKIDLKNLITEVSFQSEQINFNSKQKVLFKSQKNCDYSIVADRSRIKQVLTNLINNAFKYSQNQPIEVLLNQTHDKKNVEIIISDLGVGINDDELQEIFKPFKQGSKTIGEGGVGLGLAICQNIVDYHGGKIWAENNHHRLHNYRKISQEALGTSFHVTLPKNGPEELQTLQNPTAIFKKTEAQMLQASQDQSPLKDHLKEFKDSFKVLVVEDEEILRHSLKLILNNAGLNVIISENGNEALEILQNDHVDLIITDMMMPGMYGTELISRIKQNKKLKNIPIIIQSGVDDSLELKKTLEMGIEYYITKPYDRKILLDKVFNIYEKSQAAN